jgi:hypothetical protein
MAAPLKVQCTCFMFAHLSPVILCVPFHWHPVSPACFKECLTKTNYVIISAEFVYDFLGWEISYNVIECTVPIKLDRLNGNMYKVWVVGHFSDAFTMQMAWNKWMLLCFNCCLECGIEKVHDNQEGMRL